MMSKTLNLYFGALSDSIEKQLTAQGFEFNKEEVDHFQQDIDALNRLRIRGYITDSQIDKINKKLFNEIRSSVIKSIKLQP